MADTRNEMSNTTAINLRKAALVFTVSTTITSIYKIFTPINIILGGWSSSYGVSGSSRGSTLNIRYSAYLCGTPIHVAVCSTVQFNASCKSESEYIRSTANLLACTSNLFTDNNVPSRRKGVFKLGCKMACPSSWQHVKWRCRSSKSWFMCMNCLRKVLL